MKLKTVEIEGKIYAEVDTEGRVLYDNEGNEFAFDANQTYSKIQELTGEAQRHREAKESTESSLAELKKKIEGVDLSKMVDAGKLDEVKAQLTQTYEQQIADERKAREALEQKYNSEKLTTAFNASKFVQDEVAVPPDMVLATFGKQFTLDENGKWLAKDAAGNTIYSRKRPGDVADFDEALEQIVEGYQYKDRILKASNHSGTGGEGGLNGGGVRTIRRGDFEAMTPTQRSDASKAMQEGTLKIVQ